MASSVVGAGDEDRGAECDEKTTRQATPIGRDVTHVAKPSNGAQPAPVAAPLITIVMAMALRLRRYKRRSVRHRSSSSVGMPAADGRHTSSAEPRSCWWSTEPTR